MGWLKKKPQGKIMDRGLEKNVDLKQQNLRQKNSMIKELPFFQYEPFIVLMLVFMSLFYGLYKGDLFISWIILSVGVVGIWAFKFLKFAPLGHRVEVLRVFRDGGIKFRTEKIKDRMIKFSNKEDDVPTHVSNFGKHFDVDTGKYIVIAMEGEPDNINILRRHEPTQSAKYVNDVVLKAKRTGWLDAINTVKNAAGLTSTKNILILGVIMIIGVITGFLVFKNLEATQLLLQQNQEVLNTLQRVAEYVTK